MSKKILIIDDDLDYIESMTTLLEANDYNVVYANNGTAGIEKAKQEKPDLIILDVMMTKKNEGFEVAKEINKIDDIKNIPIIMVTGIKSEMNLPFNIEPDEDTLPVKAVLEKPIRPKELINKINEIFS